MKASLEEAKTELKKKVRTKKCDCIPKYSTHV